jgi:uncharacterized protein YgiB involved in biofilm formation
MKKSRSIRLVLLGSASFALAACGDEGPPKDARFFSNLQECSAVYDTTQCLDAQKQAEQTFAADAPKFTRKEQCEAEFGAGNCETRQTADSAQNGGGGSFFMPMLMGYMMGNMLGGQNRFYEPVYRGPNNTAITQTRGGKMFNIGSFSGVGRGAASSFRPATQVAQVQRGGFGSKASAFRSSAGS